MESSSVTSGAATAGSCLCQTRATVSVHHDVEDQVRDDPRGDVLTVPYLLEMGTVDPRGARSRLPVGVLVLRGDFRKPQDAQLITGADHDGRRQSWPSL